MWKIGETRTEGEKNLEKKALVQYMFTQKTQIAERKQKGKRKSLNYIENVSSLSRLIIGSRNKYH